MSTTVYFKLYDSTGVSLIYTFPVVFSANYPHSEENLIEHKNVRGKGSIVIDGGETPWDLTLRGVMLANDYEALTVLIDAMETAIQLNTKYVLKINKTVSTFYTYNVKRILPIEYTPDNLRTNYMEYVCTLRVNAF